MKYVCPVCGEKLPRELVKIIPHTEKHIIDIIKKKHPDWIDKDGLCRKCYKYYRDEIHPK